MNDDKQDEKMTGLARTFPCLRQSPRVQPFGTTELDRWGAGMDSYQPTLAIGIA